MLLAYIDASGNVGPITDRHGGSLMYVLGCVLVDDTNWQQVTEELLNLRRRLSEQFGLRIRTEVKAQWLIRGNGPLGPFHLAPRQRFLIYRAHLGTLARLPARAFAVAVDKRGGKSGDTVFDLAWEGLLQRLERTSTNERKPFMVIHDEGEDPQVRRWVRSARQHLTAGSAFTPWSFRDNPAKLLIEDPVPRDSAESYLIQMADLVAYAAFRDVIHPGRDTAAVCPADTWKLIGPATHTAVSRLRLRASPGIVVR